MNKKNVLFFSLKSNSFISSKIVEFCRYSLKICIIFKFSICGQEYWEGVSTIVRYPKVLVLFEKLKEKVCKFPQTTPHI